MLPSSLAGSASAYFFTAESSASTRLFSAATRSFESVLPPFAPVGLWSHDITAAWRSSRTPLKILMIESSVNIFSGPASVKNDSAMSDALTVFFV